MARSSYIYILEYIGQNHQTSIVGAFTVKGSAINAMKDHPDSKNLTLTRYRDGEHGYNPGFIYDTKTLLK